MQNPFRKKKQNEPDTDVEEDGIIVLKKTRPNECGGTDATQDTKAPKEIVSEDMILFDATSSLGYLVSRDPDPTEPYDYVSAFAAPDGEGTFLFLQAIEDHRWNRNKAGRWAWVKAPVFPALTALVRECGIAEKNGYHSTTHGLPENFGGSVDVRYASGEKISFSNNQCPILSRETGNRIAALFEKAMAGEQIPMPDVTKLKEIRFSEIRQNGGYTNAVLTFLPDGTGLNAKASRYDDPKIYQSEKPVDADTMAAIKAEIERTGLFAWAGLPEKSYQSYSEKTLVFVLADGKEITVRDGKRVPDPIRDGFFLIELEMATKH